jgi:hypothetical protein
MAFNGTGSNVTSLNAENISSGTLAVARGGTGITSAGTSGNVLTSNGTAFVSQAIAAGGDYIQRIYTSPATWTKPTGLKAVSITLIAGGGGGAGSNPVGGDFKGGGAGGNARMPSVFNYVAAPSIPGPVTVTVGAGGTPGPATGAGGAGGTSSFGPFLSATGGGGGSLAPTFNQIGVGGALGGFTTGPAAGVTQYDTIQGIYGLQGTPRENASPTNKPGVGIGAAGAGGIYASGNPTAAGTDAGGAGTPGIIIVEEFY